MDFLDSSHQTTGVFSRDCLPATSDVTACALKLGEFCEENAVQEQEVNVGKVNVEEHDSNQEMPRTFKQAM
jgi:hypothetical protein